MSTLIESPPKPLIPFVEISINVVRRLQVEDRNELAKLLDEWGLSGRAQEEMWVVSLDGDRYVRSVAQVGKGSFHEVYVSTATILTPVFLSATDRFVLGHNHPSGNVEPTRDDIFLTKRLMKAAADMDLMFDDHLIVGPMHTWSSMRKLGHM